MTVTTDNHVIQGVLNSDMSDGYDSRCDDIYTDGYVFLPYPLMFLSELGIASINTDYASSTSVDT